MKKNQNLSEKEIRKELLDILLEFKKFCDKHKLRYSLDGGTLIGAIRHKGFIPWDDDIDVMMPREDYDFFRKNYKSNEYFFIDNDNKKFYHLPIGKLISRRTLCKEKNYRKIKNYGLFLDIFPLDYIPNDERIFYEMVAHKKRKTDRYLISASNYGWYTWDYLWKRKDYILNLMFIPLAFVRTIWYRYIFGYRHGYKKLNKQPEFNRKNKYLVNKYNYDKKNKKIIMDDKVAFLFWNDWKFNMAMPIKDFDKCLLKDFEGHKFKIIPSYDKYLKGFYDSDYMKLPPKEEQVNHGLDVQWNTKFLKKNKEK